MEIKDIPDIGLSVSGIMRDRSTVAITALEEWTALEEKHKCFMSKWSLATVDVSDVDVDKSIINKMSSFMAMMNHKRDECYEVLNKIILSKSQRISAPVDRNEPLITFTSPLITEYDYIIITTPCKLPVVLFFKNDTNHYRVVINNYKCVSLPRGQWTVTADALPIRKLTLNIF